MSGLDNVSTINEVKFKRLETVLFLAGFRTGIRVKCIRRMHVLDVPFYSWECVLYKAQKTKDSVIIKVALTEMSNRARNWTQKLCVYVNASAYSTIKNKMFNELKEYDASFEELEKAMKIDEPSQGYFKNAMFQKMKRILEADDDF